MSKSIVLNCRVKGYMATYACILKDMICGMIEAECDDSISGNFIRQMIPHHVAAIEMSENLLKYTDNEKLACIAQNIIAEKTESIRDMRRALCCCCNSINSCRDLCEYKCRINCIIKEMFEEMKCAYIDNSIECNFIRTMIPHHKGAIRMAKTALCYCICDELKPILESIIDSQEKGIAEMECIAECLNCRCMR
ncbi:MAG: DUF305 domain-containing protein [Firmicutes bacterium]|jgi:uncharacterized protein (DUF305 family)|nr:DUF305 domain-containing protein [Bacillota bacterium]